MLLFSEYPAVKETDVHGEKKKSKENLMELIGLRSTFPFDSSDRINWSRVLDHLITARVHQ